MPVVSDSSSTPPVRVEVQPGAWLDSRLALWLASERLLVVADLHWGYVASHRARGNLLPWWGDDEIEQRLRALIADFPVEEMIWLGDVVHAAEGAARAEAFIRTSPVRVTLIAGNHDRRWRSRGEPFVSRGSYFFHHGDVPRSPATSTVEVIGHHHPAVAWGDGAGSRLKLPALIASASRLVLPAFSPWAAGTPWIATPERSETIWAVSPARIFTLPRARAASGTAAT
jgi:metallophosphoesterase superfamily enzyme